MLKKTLLKHPCRGGQPHLPVLTESVLKGSFICLQFYGVVARDSWQLIFSQGPPLSSVEHL